MTALLFLAAVVLVCIGCLVGSTWTTQAMTTVSRRQAAERRRLNNGWRELEYAKRSSGRTHCVRCDRRLDDSGWRLVIEPVDDD